MNNLKLLLNSMYQVLLVAAMAGIVIHLVRPVVRIEVQRTPTSAYSIR